MPPLTIASALKAARSAPARSILSGKDKRIGNASAGALLALAFFFDLVQTIQLIPLVGLLFAPLSPAVSILAYAVILVLMKSLFKVEILGGRQVMMKCGGLLASLMVEFVPLLGAIPAITPGVAALIIATRLEDMTGERLVPTADDRRAEHIAVFQAAQARRLSNAKYQIREEIQQAEDEEAPAPFNQVTARTKKETGWNTIPQPAPSLPKRGVEREAA